MKKILAVITTGFVPYGGLTSVMMNYWRAISKDNISIDFASSNEPPQSLLDELAKNGSEYFKLPARKNVFLYMRNLEKLVKKYDVVHIHGNSSTSLLELFPAKIAGVKKRIVHNHNSVTSFPLLNKFLNPFFRRLYTDAIACSNLAGDWLFGKGRFKVLKNAIDINRYAFDERQRSETRKKFDISDSTIVIGHVGKFNKQKNYPHIINTFEEFHLLRPNSKLLLVAGGELENEVKKMVMLKSLDDCVIFAGRRTDIPEMMNAMDVFLFPSLWEGLPLSVLEAQASGLPVFLSDCISSEVRVSMDVVPISLQLPAKKWAEIMDSFFDKKTRNERVNENKISLTDAGFNIQIEANKLLKLYGA